MRESDRTNDRGATATPASIATLAPELRNHVAAIAEALQIVRNPDAEPNQIDAASETMQHHVDHLLRLAEGLLDTDRAANASRPSARNPIAPRRILVVDDNRDGAESLARVLELSGQHTRVAADGLSALREAEAFRPDVVLLDIGLPKLNGFEVARRIRQQPWGQSVILIAVTGWGQEEHRRESSDAGFDAHLVKPVDPIKLVHLLTSLTRNE